uniref:Uncharacterized protein n=1 Tax=Rhizophagus irregularis (strain DAOM 181602 / DAOM 197198 / MUCL 43194) TaxID=747089 RepID=U9UJW1_RHIID
MFHTETTNPRQKLNAQQMHEELLRRAEPAKNLYFECFVKVLSSREKEAKLRTLNFTYQHDYDNYTDIIISELVLQNSNLIDSNFSQQIINLTKPFKLKSLIFYEKSLILKDSMELILQKSGDYLENFVLSSTNSKPQLLELITSYCTKIKFLELNGFYEHHQDIYSTFNLIETFKQNLNYLTINTSIGLSSIKRVKYIAFRTNDHPASGSELSRLKDEVKEFRLHDIIVQDYRQMKIKFIEFLKEKI